MFIVTPDSQVVNLAQVTRIEVVEYQVNKEPPVTYVRAWLVDGATVILHETDFLSAHKLLKDLAMQLQAIDLFFLLGDDVQEEN